jgi:LEA14-like dessication related protein
VALLLIKSLKINNMKIEKKHIVVTSIALVSISLAALYWQYKRLTDSCITLNKFLMKKLTLQEVDLDLFLNFKNKSNIKINILSQDYKVYINDTEVVKASNTITQTILPKTASILAVNVNFQPNKIINTISGLATNFALAPQKVIIKVKIDVKVKLWLFTIAIPYEYVATLSDLLSNKQENKSTSNVKKC